MKALTFSRLSIVIGIVLGIVALWGATAPSATNGDGIVGGYWIVTWCPSCYDDSPDECWDSPYDCDGTITNVCYQPGAGTCYTSGNACSHPDPESWCNNSADSYCTI